MKKIFIIIWLLFTCLIAFSGTPEKKMKEALSPFSYPPAAKLNLNNNFIYPAWGFYFEVSPGISNIKNNNIPSDFWNSKASFGYILNVGYFHSLSPWVKLKSGIGISGINSTLAAKGELVSQPLTDIDGEFYIETLTLSQAEKKTNPVYFSIPFVFEFGNPNIDEIGYYVDIGIQYSFLISENNSSSGTYSTKGTYEQWGATLENVPELGFYNNKSLETNANLKKNNLSLLAGLGIFVPITSTIIFKGGLITQIGLADIANPTLPANNNSNAITDEVYAFRAKYIDSNVALTEGSKTFHIGLELGLYISRRLK